MRRPSQALPEGCPKKVMPLGDWIASNAADIPPVSEFESPKLYTAGNRQLAESPPPPAAAPTDVIGHPTKPRKRSTNTRRSFGGSMVLQQSKAKATRLSFFTAQNFHWFHRHLGNGKWKRLKLEIERIRQVGGPKALLKFERRSMLYKRSMDFCERDSHLQSWQRNCASQEDVRPSVASSTRWIQTS